MGIGGDKMRRRMTIFSIVVVFVILVMLFPKQFGLLVSYYSNPKSIVPFLLLAAAWLVLRFQFKSRQAIADWWAIILFFLIIIYQTFTTTAGIVFIYSNERALSLFLAFIFSILVILLAIPAIVFNVNSIRAVCLLLGFVVVPLSVGTPTFGSILEIYEQNLARSIGELKAERAERIEARKRLLESIQKLPNERLTLEQRKLLTEEENNRKLQEIIAEVLSATPSREGPILLNPADVLLAVRILFNQKLTISDKNRINVINSGTQYRFLRLYIAILLTLFLFVSVYSAIKARFRIYQWSSTLLQSNITKAIFSGWAIWIFLVISFVLIAEPYDSPLDSVAYFNLFLWLILPPLGAIAICFWAKRFIVSR